MRFWLYTFAYNEARLVPFLLRHYGPEWVERIVVYDNHSTDDTASILQADPRVEVRTWGQPGEYDVSAQNVMRNSIWKEARGKADWCILVDLDEFLWSPGGIPALLSRPELADAVILRGRGRQMLSPSFPADDGETQLTDLVRQGVVHGTYSKPALFRPDRLGELNAGVGLHKADPVGFDGQPLPILIGPLLLHYRYIGADYTHDRSKTLYNRIVGFVGDLAHILEMQRAFVDTLPQHAFDVIEFEKRSLDPPRPPSGMLPE